MLKGMEEKELEALNGVTSCIDMEKLAAKYADGIIANSEQVNQDIIEYAKSLNRPILDYQPAETYADACDTFYDMVWENDVK